MAQSAIITNTVTLFVNQIPGVTTETTTVSNMSQVVGIAAPGDIHHRVDVAMKNPLQCADGIVQLRHHRAGQSRVITPIETLQVGGDT